jgi:hypothetical protein
VYRIEDQETTHIPHSRRRDTVMHMQLCQGRRSPIKKHHEEMNLQVGPLIMNPIYTKLRVQYLTFMKNVPPVGTFLIYGGLGASIDTLGTWYLQHQDKNHQKAESTPAHRLQNPTSPRGGLPSCHVSLGLWLQPGSTPTPERWAPMPPCGSGLWWLPWLHLPVRRAPMLSHMALSPWQLPWLHLPKK